jgi:GDP-L-fucose synthase
MPQQELVELWLIVQKRVEFMLENLKININLLESCIPYPEIKIINLGSSCIYPLNSTNPIAENQFMKGELEPTNSPYAMAKNICN